jgi:hypothetical protein
MQQCSDKFGVDVGNKRFTDIDHADNDVLFESNPDGWSDTLCSFEAAASSIGLQTNGLKTTLQNIGSNHSPDPVSMGAETVDSVTQFTYLSSDADSDDYSIPEMHIRLGTANSVMELA